MLAGFVLARAAAGLADSTIASDVMNLEQVRAWLGRPLWEMEPADADAYFGSAGQSRRLTYISTRTSFTETLGGPTKLCANFAIVDWNSVLERRTSYDAA